MERDIIERAVEFETAQSSSLLPRSDRKIGVYLHNVASGPTWDEGYVSVSHLQNTPISESNTTNTW